MAVSKKLCWLTILFLFAKFGSTTGGNEDQSQLKHRALNTESRRIRRQSSLISSMEANRIIQNCTDNWRIPLGEKCNKEASAEAFAKLTELYSEVPIERIPGNAFKDSYQYECAGTADTDCVENICTCNLNKTCHKTARNLAVNCDKEFDDFILIAINSNPKKGNNGYNIVLPPFPEPDSLLSVNQPEEWKSLANPNSCVCLIISSIILVLVLCLNPN